MNSEEFGFIISKLVVGFDERDTFWDYAFILFLICARILNCQMHMTKENDNKFYFCLFLMKLYFNSVKTPWIVRLNYSKNQIGR